MPIITPRDVVTLTIHNDPKGGPPRVEMAVSRELPVPYVCIILSNTIAGLQQQLGQQMAAGLIRTGATPQTEPPAEPIKEPANGTS